MVTLRDLADIANTARGDDARQVYRILRNLLAIVQQDVFLFDGSVRDNIAYGRHDATDAEIEDAAARTPGSSASRRG